MSLIDGSVDGKFSISLASPGKRLVAQLIDAIIAFSLFYVTLHVVEVLSLSGQVDVFSALVVGGSYYFLSDAMPKGQSIGKRMLKIAVVSDVSYIDCNVFQSVLRNITTPFLGVIDWVFIFTSSRKRLGDMLASTIVINS
ncbi:RDD family protein [Pseudomonas sp.]|uniref:RDD family protein n=1 Tax=Pseudomonas sp. TaxID=306 RepID=UPI0027328DC8|nr:RDD family protein [Pseudomonas sp.]MDP2747392.1 RDD family protein [Pseudomonas sp.]